jgi:hypothetical protein
LRTNGRGRTSSAATDNAVDVRVVDVETEPEAVLAQVEEIAPAMT